MACLDQDILLVPAGALENFTMQNNRFHHATPMIDKPEKETLEKWLRCGSKSFLPELCFYLNMLEINKIVKLMEMRKIFYSPLANHFSAVVQLFYRK
jgi:hypothetical protein